MKRDAQQPQVVWHLTLDATSFKSFLRDLLFRESGKSYFKHLVIPRQHRWLGAWRRLATYKAERQLLPVGGRHLDRHIREFFTTHGCLRAVFQEGGMPVTAIYILRQHCQTSPVALAQILCVDCTQQDDNAYDLILTGKGLDKNK